MVEITGRSTEGIYLGKPLRVFEGQARLTRNDPNFRGGEDFGKEFTVEVMLAIHPNNSKKIIINVPGFNGDIDGYENKYKILAGHMQSDNLGAVIRTDNRILPGYLVDAKLRIALNYARENSFAISGDSNPEIMLMGFSAGASAIAAVAYEYPEVTKILLFAPSGNMPFPLIKNGLNSFKGGVYIVQGEQDEVVGPRAGKLFYDLATGASCKEIFMISDCDHRFTGEVNGRIVSEAPYYAFSSSAEKINFPDPRGGFKLYD